ncbi:MAG TPA: tetratricopeptide repeat protein [Anaerolineales bacterium]|nr:tetratricopeptide repeat protein [Anaerolineales bacterium]
MSGDQQAFQYAMNQGHSAAWDQEWENAVTFYRMAMAEFPDNYNALTSLALALYELQKYPEAGEFYQKAALISPNDPMPFEKVAEIIERSGDISKATKAYMDVADVYARNKDVDKAVRTWTHVLALNPEYMAAHTRLALVYERLGNTTQAMGEYIAIASLLQGMGNVSRAIQTMKHALDVVPNSKEASLTLSLLQSGKPLPRPSRPRGVTGPLSLTQAGQRGRSQSENGTRSRYDPIQEAKQKALSMLAEVLFEQEEAQEPQARKGMATILKGTGELEPSIVDQSKIIQHLSLAIDLQSHGQEKEAITELEQAMQAGLENSAAYYVLGFMQSKNEQPDNAVNNLRKATQHEFFGMGARLLLGLTLYKMNKIRDAAVEYIKALRIADAECISADLSEELSQLYEPLIEAFDQQLDEKLLKRICENISKLLIRPDWKDQIQKARQQLPPQPSGSGPMPLAEMLTESTSSQLVESLSKVNQLAKSEKLLTAMEEAYYALKFAPTYLPLHVCIADLLLQEGRIEDAVEKYSIIARSYNVRGEVNRAISLLKRVTELNPIDNTARNNLIELLIARGRITDAIQEYIKLAESYYNHADLPMARKTYGLAYRFAQQSNADRDARVKLLLRMADIETQSLELRNAIRVFEQIRGLDPDNTKARDMLFDLNMRLGQSNPALAELDNFLNHLISSHRTTDALEYLNNKIHENQTLPGLYRRLAEIYRLLGRKEEAIAQLETSKELSIQAGNIKGAIESLQIILALNPYNTNVYQRMLVELEAELEKSTKQ